MVYVIGRIDRVVDHVEVHLLKWVFDFELYDNSLRVCFFYLLENWVEPLQVQPLHIAAVQEKTPEDVFELSVWDLYVLI